LKARRQIWTVLILALSAPLVHAQAQGVTTFLESSGTQQKLRSNAGLSLQNDRLRMRAGLALRTQQVAAPIYALDARPSGSTEVVPNLRSAFTIAKNLDLETGVSFAEWNARSEAKFDTRLRYTKPLRMFFDELDGSLWRSPEGLTKQGVRLGFHELLGGDGVGLVPLTIAGAAVFEATQSGAAALAGQSNDSRRLRLETRVAGLMPTFLGADHAVGFSVEKTAGTRTESSSTVTYDQSWTLSPLTKLGLNLQFLRQSYSAADDFEPSLDFTWRSKF
jgi:hypothetical protein